MPQYQVIVDKLNKRKGPVIDFTDKSNITGVALKDYSFESDGEISNILGRWVRDRDGYYYWGEGLKAGLPPANNVVAGSQILTGDNKMGWGLQKLLIGDFWVAAKNKGQNIKIAILDTGISTEHPEFDFTKIRQINILTGGSDAKDTNGHGTHVAGIIAAQGINITGVAPDVDLLIIKISETSDIWNIENLINGIQHAIVEKADIISISGEFNSETANLDALKNKIKEATDKGIITVASAGNNFNDFPVESYPAAFDECISVGSIQQDGTRADSSSHSTKLDVVAPGEQIYSAWTGKSYNTDSGTSMAAPFVSGVIAVLKSYARTTFQKELTPSEIQVIIDKSADDAGEIGFDTSYGFGIVNPLKALKTIFN
jgi:major intracellular serine protease